jgi:NAD-dependent DNA ligase
MNKDYKSLAEFLMEEILRYRYFYYVKGQPIITDHEYDKAEAELRAIATEYMLHDYIAELDKPGSDRRQDYEYADQYDNENNQHNL